MYISLYYELTKSLLFEFENDVMELSRHYSFTKMITAADHWNLSKMT